MTDSPALSASEFLNSIVGGSSREPIATSESRAQTVTPDDGLEVVDSDDDEDEEGSDAEYAPENGGKTSDPETETDPMSEEDEPEAEAAGPAYAPAKIEVKEGKIFINGSRVAKTGIKKVLLEHESTQPGGASTWKDLKARYAEANVPGYSDLVETVKTTTPKKPPATAGASKKVAPFPKLPTTEPIIRSKLPPPMGGLKVTKSKNPAAKATFKKPLTKIKSVEQPAPATPDPEPTPDPATTPPEPTPEPTPESAPVTAPVPVTSDPEFAPVTAPAPAPPIARSKRFADDGDATTLEEMRVTIDRYNEKLRPLGAEFTLMPTKAIRLA